MKYEIIPTGQFRKDYKRAVKRGCDINELKKVIALLAEGTELPQRYKDHTLSGNFSGCRECHISPDWLLVYKIENNMLILILERTGSHSDLF